MPHVQLAAGVGEHGEAVVFGFRSVFGDVENTLVVPFFLRRRLDGGGLVMFLHGHSVFRLKTLEKIKMGL